MISRTSERETWRKQSAEIGHHWRSIIGGREHSHPDGSRVQGLGAVGQVRRNELRDQSERIEYVRGGAPSCVCQVVS